MNKKKGDLVYIPQAVDLYTASGDPEDPQLRLQLWEMKTAAPKYGILMSDKPTDDFWDILVSGKLYSIRTNSFFNT